MAHIEYAWKDGRTRKADPVWFGQELDKIVDRDGQVTADAVQELARPKKSPIHSEFEWDNDKCGHLYRNEQARRLIRDLVVVQVGQDDIKAPIRAFVNLSNPISEEEAEESDTPPRSYHHIVTVLSDRDRRLQLLAQARGELNMWRKKYADLNEFAGLIPVINQYLEAAE